MLKPAVILYALALVWLSSETSAQNRTSISSLRFLDEYIVPYNKIVEATRVGGLSGIDYDSESQVYYLISDDRSTHNPARFYTAKIHLSPDGKIDSVQFLQVHTLLQENGQPYPSGKTDPALAPDPEAIRNNVKTNQLVWTSEGDKGSLANPSVNLMQPDGKLIATYSLPGNLSMQPGERGPRQNGTLEGVSFNNDYSVLYTAMEEPLYEDGPRTQISETNSWIRVTAFDVAARTPVAQYAYRLEPLAYKPFPSGTFAINGVTEILAWDRNKILFVERSYSTGRLACTVKLFMGDLVNADNILDVPSLAQQPPINPIRKKLLLNMDDLGIFIDNIEGVTYGPRLPNGNATLIFVSDNNFQSFQKTQFLLFEIIAD